MLICFYCGASIPDDVAICPVCGKIQPRKVPVIPKTLKMSTKSNEQQVERRLTTNKLFVIALIIVMVLISMILSVKNLLGQ